MIFTSDLVQSNLTLFLRFSNFSGTQVGSTTSATLSYDTPDADTTVDVSVVFKESTVASSLAITAVGKWVVAAVDLLVAQTTFQRTL